MNTEDLFKVKDKRGNDMYLARNYLLQSFIGLRLFGGDFNQQAVEFMNFANTHHFEEQGESTIHVFNNYFKGIDLPEHFDALIATVIKRIRKYPHYQNPFDLPNIDIKLNSEAILAVVLLEYSIRLDLYYIGIETGSLKQIYEDLFFNPEFEGFNAINLESYIDNDLSIYGENKESVLDAIGKLLRISAINNLEDLENEDIQYILKVIFANVAEAVKILYSVREWKINNIDQNES